MELELPSGISLKEILQIRKYLYFPALVLVIVVSLIAFVIVPNVRKVSLLRNEVALSKEELALLEEKVAVLESFDETSLLQKLELLEHLLPSNKDVFSLLVSLDDLAKQNGVSLSNFQLRPGSIATEGATPSATPQEPVATSRSQTVRARKTGLDSLSVSVDIFGPLDGVSAFLAGVERRIPLMKLTELHLSPPGIVAARAASPSASPPLNASLVLDLFYASIPSHIGSVTDPITTLTEAEEEFYAELLTYSEPELNVPPSVVTGKENLFTTF